MTTLYRYSFDKRLIAFWGVFGVRPGKDGVILTDDGRLRASFGLLKLETTLDNVDGAHVTRNYRWWTAAGARASLKDDGLTFGTNANAGVCIHFRREGTVATQAHRALRADSHRRGCRRVDGGAYPSRTPGAHGRSRLAISESTGCRAAVCLSCVNNTATPSDTGDIAGSKPTAPTPRSLNH